jgi:peptidoglycan/LPS O-acetylase OafA/YrhL
LPSIQWLRAIAAMMVVIHHINFHTDWLLEQAGGAPSEVELEVVRGTNRQSPDIRQIGSM